MKLATFALMSVLSAPMIMGQEGTDGTTSYFEHIVNDKNDCDSKPMIALFGLLDGQCTPNFIAPDTCQQAIYNEATGQKISTQPWHRAICRPQTTAISKLSPPEGMLKSSGQDYLRVTGYTDANCTELWFDVYYRMDKQPKQENPLCARLLMEVGHKVFETDSEYVVEYLDGDCNAKPYGIRKVPKNEVKSRTMKCYSDDHGGYKMQLA